MPTLDATTTHRPVLTRLGAMMAQLRPPRGRGGYDMFVWWMRFLLTIFAGLLAFMVLLWPVFRSGDVSFTLSYEDVAVGDDQIRMTNPRYVGADRRGQLFTVTAASGVQPRPEEPRVELSDIFAAMELLDGRHIEARSGTGVLEVDRNYLELDQNVGIVTSNGYSFLAGQTFFDLASGKVSSQEAIRGAGPMGIFEAHGFEIMVDEQVALFKDGVHMVIEPGGRSLSDTNESRP